ncbi:dihydroneopterin aldolase [Bacteroidia bacterium]|jgi:dihydroneopterin aldolase|nr:dihydroneopterin aldolase [Bacteroidia bacterium]MDB4173735.1 dihydroneopterin aldolase [Bacteroidia bacterium]
MSDSLETILSIEDIRIKAYHGWYAAERKIGGMYRISVRIYSQCTLSENFDDIEDSINYEDIHAIIIRQMKQEFRLIETCCKALWNELKQLSPYDKWEVSLVKEDVPIKHVGSTTFCIKG